MKVPQFMPWVGSDEHAAIKSCFDNNWITEGPHTEMLKKKLLALTGAKYGEFCPNGTLAIYLGLKAMGVNPGDEILVPNFTFNASASAVIMAGAIPVFVDVDDHLQIDLKKCTSRISKKTTALMATHMYGTCGNMDDISRFAKAQGLMLIEDAAQAVGVKWNNRHAGTFGDVGTFSFFADKTLTCGEGGFVVTNDENISNRLKFLRNQGRLHRGAFIHPEIGFNFRITDIHAAIGLAQFRKLSDIINRKLEIFEMYSDRLGDVSRFKFFRPMEGSSFVPFRTCIMDSRGDARSLMVSLKSAGIESRSFFYPLHRQPCFSYLSSAYAYTDDDFEISRRMYDSGMCLPTFHQITDKEIDYVCNVIKSVCG